MLESVISKEGVGRLDADLVSRVNSNLSVFASGSMDTNLDFEVSGGLKVVW